jgi:chitodextrinase
MWGAAPRAGHTIVLLAVIAAIVFTCTDATAARRPRKDATAPSAPARLAATGATATSITLSWLASTDDVGVKGYNVYRSSTKAATTTALQYTFGGLTCGTSYTLAVEAFDAAGNVSARASLTAATSACDATRPSAPPGLTTSAAAATSLTLAWLASSDNVGVQGYNVYNGSTKLATTTALRYAFTGLTCGTSYTLGVEAFDAAGNVSARSSLTAATLVCPSPLGAPSYRFMINSDSGGQIASQYGYDLLDVGSAGQADGLPPGTQGLIWAGDYDNTTCSWEISDSALAPTVQAAASDTKVFGYFFSDEPDPYACPNAYADHRARSSFIHSIDPLHKTVMLVDSNSDQQTLDQIPHWAGAADYFALDPYPCYQAQACNYAWIDQVIAAANNAGLNYWGVAQAFQDATWRWPTSDELSHMLNQWASSRQTGMMTFAWTWSGNTLAAQPSLLSTLSSFNSGAPASTGGDTIPPSTPANLAASGATATSISLTWSPSTDNIGVTSYDVYRSGALAGTSNSTSYTVGGLACGTSYTFSVDAKDAAGNASSSSGGVASSTAACSASSDPVITAAGDICGSTTDCAPTASLISQINPNRVLTLGDNAYADGALSDYNSYYDPNWGRFKATTSPAPGNHDYHQAGGAGYFGYFGALAPAEYYSYDVGSWHLISLDGEISASDGSPQETWLRNDLAAHANQCVLAYWHEPRWSSGTTHGSESSFDAFWRDLYGAHADVVLNGHEHNYERFAKQSPSGSADPNGIREFVVGTGGASHGYPFGTPLPTSEVRNDSTWGVLKLTLHPGSYDWQFVPVAGSTFGDSGTTACT